MQQSMSSGMCDSAPPPSSDSHTIISAGGSELLHLKSNSSTKAMLEQLDQLLSNGFEFLELLCKETPSYGGDGKKIAKHLLSYFRGDARKMLWVVLWATTREVDSTNSNETLFRESNVQTELMFGFFYTERGKTYLNYLLNPLLTALLKYPPVAFPYGEPTAEYKQFQAMLVEQMQTFVDRFVEIDRVPKEFQRVFRHMKKQMNNKFPDPNTQNIILSLLFLRVICPVIIRPDIIDLTVPTTHIKQFTTCAKALQALANGSLYAEDDPIQSAYNPFLNNNINRVRQFFLSVSKEKPEGGIPDSVLLARDSYKKKDVTKDEALINILKNLQGEVHEYVAKEHRKAKGAMQFKFFMDILDSPKWKLWKQRPDTQTWTAKDENFFAIKICGSVRTSLNSLQEYVHANKIIRAPPNYVKGGRAKPHDDESAVDQVVTSKIDAKCSLSRDLIFCKQDHDYAQDQTVTLVWCMDNNRKSGGFSALSSTLFPSALSSSSACPAELGAGPWGAFKAVGCIIQPLPENPMFSWFMIVFNLDRKVSLSSDGMDLYLYKTLQRVRSDTELPDPPLSPSRPLSPTLSPSRPLSPDLTYRPVSPLPPCPPSPVLLTRPSPVVLSRPSSTSSTTTSTSSSEPLDKCEKARNSI